jgi:hypothetical protein
MRRTDRPACRRKAEARRRLPATSHSPELRAPTPNPPTVRRLRWFGADRLAAAAFETTAGAGKGARWCSSSDAITTPTEASSTGRASARLLLNARAHRTLSPSGAREREPHRHRRCRAPAAKGSASARWPASVPVPQPTSSTTLGRGSASTAAISAGRHQQVIQRGEPHAPGCRDVPLLSGHERGPSSPCWPLTVLPSVRRGWSRRRGGNALSRSRTSPRRSPCGAPWLYRPSCRTPGR